ncbi:MAG: hypothetical protein IMZ61_10015 [Planctomycetes bacterium]|nr:hypothetical protein [Planctomycetota bacterium]
MALRPRTKGGQGGKKGHSNMAHWDGTEAIKASHKKHLRAESKKAVRERD